MFIALDASPVNDLFDKTSMAKLRNGFLLRIIDQKHMLTGLRSYFENLSNRYKKNIRLMSQWVELMQQKQSICMKEFLTTIGLPARYIHSSVAMAEWSDVEAARNMVLALIHDLTPEIIDSLKESNR